MIQDHELLIAMAEIAGVFVGFGALISVTRRNEIVSSQLGLIRAVVTIGLLVIVAALVPVGLARYGLAGHDLWALCSLIFLLLSWVVIALSLRSRDNRQLMRSRTQSNPVMAVLVWLLLEVPLQLPLILTLVGSYPALEPAFYITALVLNLFQAALILAQLVYSQDSAPSD